MQRFPLFKIYTRPSTELKKEYQSDLGPKSAGSDMMPGQIPDPSLPAGTLPSLGSLAGIPATTLTDQLKFADLRSLGAMLSPLHFLGRLGKRPAPIKAEMDEEEDRRKRRREKNKVAAARCRNKKKERTEFLQRVRGPRVLQPWGQTRAPGLPWFCSPGARRELRGYPGSAALGPGSGRELRGFPGFVRSLWRIQPGIWPPGICAFTLWKINTTLV
uniref:Jun dimerization protein 2 n=1 Tax=Paramormyrops kingsleyae TaxID=1676925 RepID=A0A3B3RDW6_9TELE